jgi:predicted chitinase
MTLGSAINSAVGIGQGKLTVIKDTFLKRSAANSTDLREDQKIFVASGFELEISSYTIEGSHCLFESSDSKYLGKGYAFLEHIEVSGNKLPTPNQLLLLCKDSLFAFATQTPASRLNSLLQPINSTLAKYQINTPLRICHFLAQIAHESDGFNTNEEYASGEDYEWRTDLGNTQEGDGVRFKGRGLIQVTGRANYFDCGKALGVDLIDNPERLADFDLACLSAGWYWQKHKLNSCADADEIERITKIINGGYNGLDDRQAYFDRARTVFGL